MFQEDSTIELTKMAKVLTAIDEGKNIKNKKIDDVLTNSRKRRRGLKRIEEDHLEGLKLFLFSSIYRHDTGK